MTSIGIVRCTDPVGRITLPKEMRKLLDLSPGDSIEIFTEEDSIILNKYQTKCALCDEFIERDKENEFKGKAVCKNCINQMKDFVKK